MSSSAEKITDFEEKIDALIEGNELAEEDASSYQEKALDGLIADLVGVDDTVCNVYRTGRGKKLSFMFEFSPGEYTLGEILTNLRDEHGGGDFRIHVRANDKLVANRAISVEAPKKKPENVNQNTGLETVLMAMQENTRISQENMQSMMMAQAKEGREAAQRQTELMLGLFQTMAANKPEPPPQQNPLEMITAFAALKDAFTPPPDKTDKVDVLMKGIELAQGLSAGEANSSSVLQTAIKEVGGPLIEAAKLAKAAQAAKQTQALPQQTAESEPQITAEKPADNPTAQADQPTDEIAAALQPYEFYINSMIPLAKADADPQTYANMIIDQIGDEQAHQIFSQENAYEILAHYFPQITECEGWFRELIEIGKEITEPEPIPDDPLTSDGQHATIEPTANEFIPGHALQTDTTRATDGEPAIAPEGEPAAAIDPIADPVTNDSQSLASSNVDGLKTGREGDQTNP